MDIIVCKKVFDKLDDEGTDRLGPGIVETAVGHFRELVSSLKLCRGGVSIMIMEMEQCSSTISLTLILAKNRASVISLDLMTEDII